MNKSFVEEVATMRSLQKEYFRFRDEQTLYACKRAEEYVDSLLDRYLGPIKKPTQDNNHPKLF